MKDDNTTFEDADNFSYNFDKDRLTFKDIILQHLKKISQLASVEFRGGYWETKPSPNPNSNQDYRIYIPDTREVYSNAVECFADMLAPYFDDEMKKAEYFAKKEDHKAYMDNTIIKQNDREEQTPEEIEEYERHFKDIWKRVSYRSERVKISRKLFRALCCFLYRKKYLDLGVIED